MKLINFSVRPSICYLIELRALEEVEDFWLLAQCTIPKSPIGHVHLEEQDCFANSHGAQTVAVVISYLKGLGRHGHLRDRL